MTTRSMRSLRSSLRNCVTVAGGGVYGLSGENGNRFGSPRTWTWQSQACAGTGKLGGPLASLRIAAWHSR